MKKLFLPCLSIVFFSLIMLVACKSKSGGSGEAYTLKMRLQKGDKFGHDMDMGMKIAFEIMDQKIDMNMDIKGATNFEVLDSSNGVKDLSMTYTKMKMSVEMKGMPGMDRSLGNDEASNRIVGKKVKLKMNDKNEVVEIEGFDDIMWGDSADVATREQMKKMFSKEQINKMFGTMFQMYPDKPVRVGDSWEKEYEAGIAGISMKMKATYTLKSVKNGVAYVDIDGSYKGKGSMEQQSMKFDIDMDGKQKGNINIGVSDGYLKDSQMTMDVDATMSMQGQKVPMKLKGEYLIKGI